MISRSDLRWTPESARIDEPCLQALRRSGPLAHNDTPATRTFLPFGAVARSLAGTTLIFSFGGRPTPVAENAFLAAETDDIPDDPDD